MRKSCEICAATKQPLSPHSSQAPNNFSTTSSTQPFVYLRHSRVDGCNRQQRKQAERKRKQSAAREEVEKTQTPQKKFICFTNCSFFFFWLMFWCVANF